MELSRTLTGRAWGNKLPFAVIKKNIRNQNGLRCAIVEADFWLGPVEAGQTGQYERIRWQESAGVRGADNSFQPRKPTSCSFESELARAVK